jgi:hypothetical protein
MWTKSQLAGANAVTENILDPVQKCLFGRAALHGPTRLKLDHGVIGATDTFMILGKHLRQVRFNPGRRGGRLAQLIVQKRCHGFLTSAGVAFGAMFSSERTESCRAPRGVQRRSGE